MLLLVGLGNPGAKYAGNRHNIGFMAVQEIAKRHGIGPWRRRFQGVACEGPIGGERALLLLPGTFMNESGRAVAEAARFYKLPLDQITVFHDEIDLRPDMVQHYVLSDFAKSERGWVEALITTLADNAELLARGEDASFQNKVHLAMVAKGFGEETNEDLKSERDK